MTPPLMRFGTIALVGRTNVGKSTFLNQALGEPLAITSPLPQTTRDALLGVVQHGEAQMAFLDTPGVHRPRTELGRRMNTAAYDSARAAEAILFMTDVWTKAPKKAGASAWEAEPGPLDDPWIRPGDKEVISQLNQLSQVPVLCVINKADLAKDKSLILPMLQAYNKAHNFAALVPTSVRRHDGVAQTLAELTKLLPEGPPGYDEDTLTNRPVLFFVREYIREAVLNQLSREVPHAIAVSIEHADESPTLMRLSATIHVEKMGQRRIVVGKGGDRIKSLGIAARGRIEELIGKQVHLELFVRITSQWKDMPRQLAELGYDAGETTSLETSPVRSEEDS